MVQEKVQVLKMITKEILKNFNECAVEIIDCDNKVNRGWFINIDGRYKLFPFDTIWETYVYTVGAIKSIKHLTNNLQITRQEIIKIWIMSHF